MVTPLKPLRMPLFIGCLKILRESNKTHSDDEVLGEELLKYIALNTKKLEYTAIKEF